MHTVRSALVLLLLGGFTAPALAQGIPDYIPDEPGEPLIDRQKERWAEQYRGTLSRFFTRGSVDVAPTGTGLAYQANLNMGYRLRNGDAVFVTLAARDAPVVRLDGDGLEPTTRTDTWRPMVYAGAGYEVAGTRFFGESPLGARTGLGFAAGLIRGDATALTLDLTPSYDLLHKHNLVVPVGVRLSVLATDVDGIRTGRAFLGLDVGVRYFWLNRDRMD